MDEIDPIAPAPEAGAGLGALLDGAGLSLLREGGPVIWIIAALSVAALAILLWKAARFAALGVWRRNDAEAALALWRAGDLPGAERIAGRGGVVARVLGAGMGALRAGAPEAQAREETERRARAALTELRSGLRGLEVVVASAPLLGLLGTVLGMIAAFQTLEASGGRADPGQLAGGIWEALLTTAAGMAVAIPAGIALSWCESVVESARSRIEDAATRLFLAAAPAPERARDRGRAA